MPHGTADLRGRLVLSKALVDDLPEKVILSPGEVFDLSDKLRPNPMHAA